MDPTTTSADRTSQLPAQAALIPAASRLTGVNKGWYFAVLVRAAYSRLEGV